MASPIKEGTYSSAAFSSKDVRIIKETIHLSIDKNFKTASYIIEYFIKADSAGKQIPLLFFAKDYKNGFNIWVDGQPTTLLDIPQEYKTCANSPFQNFYPSFSRPAGEDEPETVSISWDKNRGSVYELNDLKYFETSLSKGEHTIRVTYTANARTDISDWVKEYSFNYSLSPAKNWKSFGSLEITVDGYPLGAPINSNLGAPVPSTKDGATFWKFDKIPEDYFTISYTPEISSFAQTLINIDPSGLAMIGAFLMALFHFWVIQKFRKAHPTIKYSWVVITGSLVIPFLMLLIYILSFTCIDHFIGANAGRYHGYTFLAIVFYPLLLPVYWLVMWGADRLIKRKLNRI
jgi:hypothetical protein